MKFKKCKKNVNEMIKFKVMPKLLVYVNDPLELLRLLVF